MNPAQAAANSIRAKFPRAATLSASEVAACIDWRTLDTIREALADGPALPGLRQRKGKARAPVAAVLGALESFTATEQAAQAERAKARDATRARRLAVEMRQRQRSRAFWLEVIAAVDQIAVNASLPVSAASAPSVRRAPPL